MSHIKLFPAEREIELPDFIFFFCSAKNFSERGFSDCVFLLLVDIETLLYGTIFQDPSVSSSQCTCYCENFVSEDKVFTCLVILC